MCAAGNQQNSLGSRNSEMKEKKATWPAYAKMMLVTAKKAGAKLGEYVAARLRLGFGSTPNAIIVKKTAPQMEMKAASCQLGTTNAAVRAHSHTMLKYDTFFKVLGRVRIQRTTKPTTPQTMLQVALSVIEFMAMVKVKMCDPMTAHVSVLS